MQRQGLAPTFTDAVLGDLGGPRSRAFFEQCERCIPWDELVASLPPLYAEDRGQGGRPAWPTKMMLRVVFLQKCFNLSDPMMEEMLLERISFRRFVGLSWDDRTPDETTICTFRRRLQAVDGGAVLFETVLSHLREQGLVLHNGTLVDATIIQAPTGRKREDGTSTADPCAGKTCKHGRAYFGYRAHVATDRRGIITNFVLDSANVSEHVHADALMAQEKTGVYADSGYRSQERQQQLASRGVFAGLCHRRVRGQKELTPEQRAFNRMVAGVRAIVEHPFAWMRRMGLGRTRYRGLRRNATDFALTAAFYNLRRSFTLAPPQTSAR